MLGVDEQWGTWSGEIILPETMPETEWLRGRAVQKVSPKRRHGELQWWLASRLGADC